MPRYDHNTKDWCCWLPYAAISWYWSEQKQYTLLNKWFERMYRVVVFIILLIKSTQTTDLDCASIRSQKNNKQQEQKIKKYYGGGACLWSDLLRLLLIIIKRRDSMIRRPCAQLTRRWDSIDNCTPEHRPTSCLTRQRIITNYNATNHPQ